MRGCRLPVWQVGGRRRRARRLRRCAWQQRQIGARRNRAAAWRGEGCRRRRIALPSGKKDCRCNGRFAVRDEVESEVGTSRHRFPKACVAGVAKNSGGKGFDLFGVGEKNRPSIVGAGCRRRLRPQPGGDSRPLPPRRRQQRRIARLSLGASHQARPSKTRKPAPPPRVVGMSGALIFWERFALKRRDELPTKLKRVSPPAFSPYSRTANY